MIMEAMKPQDLLSAGWNPRRAMVQSQPESEGLRTRRSGGTFQSESQQTCHPGIASFSALLQMQERQMSELSSWQEGDLCSAFGSVQVFSQRGMAPLHPGGALCFTWSTNSNANLIQKQPQTCPE